MRSVGIWIDLFWTVVAAYGAAGFVLFHFAWTPWWSAVVLLGAFYAFIDSAVDGIKKR